MKIRNHWRARKPLIQETGFSFIELLIALSIFTVGILGIMSLQGITLMSTDFSGQMTTARILTTDQLERLSGLAYTDAALSVCSSGTPWCHKDVGRGGNGSVFANLSFTGAVATSGRFRREWDVAQVVTDVKKVTVRVWWTDAPGGASSAKPFTFNRSVSMATTKVNP